MRAVCVALLVAGAFAEAVTLESFRAWAAQNGKTYASTEEAKRFAVFQENAAIIQKLNAEHHSATFGFTQFADLTNAEFAAAYTRPIVSTRPRHFVTLPTDNLRDEVNWVTAGAVTPIKNQGSCGSCWAFSTTGAVEGATFIHSGVLYSLSEQQLVDCSSAYGNEGCNGGLMDSAFKYIIANRGLCNESDYVYKGVDGKCKTCTPVAASAINGFVDIPADITHDNQLLAAVAQQPVAVAIEADQVAFQFYQGGVLSDACGTSLDHGVLAVGYGNDAASGKDYWLVKNSWGTSWGESGFVRIARGKDECGINLMASYPTF